jgi:hypothetical protein
MRRHRPGLILKRFQTFSNPFHPAHPVPPAKSTRANLLWVVVIVSLFLTPCLLLAARGLFGQYGVG